MYDPGPVSSVADVVPPDVLEVEVVVVPPPPPPPRHCARAVPPHAATPKNNKTTLMRAISCSSLVPFCPAKNAAKLAAASSVRESGRNGDENVTRKSRNSQECLQ